MLLRSVSIGYCDLFYSPRSLKLRSTYLDIWWIDPEELYLL